MLAVSHRTRSPARSRSFGVRGGAGGSLPHEKLPGVFRTNSQLIIPIMSGRAPSYPGAPPQNPACGFPAPGSSNQLTQTGSSHQTPRGHGAGPLSARHAWPDDTLVRRPLPSTGITPLPWYYRPIRLPPVGARPSGCPWGRGPRVDLGTARGSPGFRALPVPACRRLRPRWTRVRARLGARPLLPSQPLHTGRRPRCSGFRGWSRSLPPALAYFGPQSSCLRFARAVTHPLAQDSVPATGWLAPSPVGLPTHHHCCAGHPLGSADLARRTQRPVLRPVLRIVDTARDLYRLHAASVSQTPRAMSMILMMISTHPTRRMMKATLFAVVAMITKTERIAR